MSNPIPNPVEAVMAMFFMSMTSFGDYYPAMEKTDHEFGAKVNWAYFIARNAKIYKETNIYIQFNIFVSSCAL